MSKVKALLSKPHTPKRVVLLGGGGFIGRGLSALFDKKNIPYLTISHQELDLTKPESSRALSARLQPEDVVVILSALTPRYGRGIDVFVKNICIAQTICNALQEVKASHVVYLSSDAVYPFEGALINEESAAVPLDLYGAMHRSREIMFQAAAHAPLISLRSTLVYGKGDPHNSYGPNRMRRSSREQKKIMLFGKGEEVRDHIFIDDLTNLILQVILYRCEGVLNLATGSSISYWDLAHKIAHLFDEEIVIETSQRHNPITYRHYDVTAIYELFPFFQFTPLDDALIMIDAKESKYQLAET